MALDDIVVTLRSVNVWMGSEKFHRMTLSLPSDLSMSKLSLGDIGWHCPYHQIGQCLDFYWMTLASQPDLSISRFYRMSSEKCHHMILSLPSDMSMLEFDWMVFRESHRKMFIEDFLSSENCPQMILQLSSNLSSFELYHKMFHKMTFLS